MVDSHLLLKEEKVTNPGKNIHHNIIKRINKKEFASDVTALTFTENRRLQALNL